MNKDPINTQSEYFESDAANPIHENLVSFTKQAFQDKSHHSIGTDAKTEHVPLAPEVIGQIGSFAVTNSLVFSLVLW